MTIRVYIDRLVLDEPLVAPADSAALTAAVTERLTELLAGTGLRPDLAAGGSFAGVRAGAIDAAAATPAALGGQVAEALYAGLGARAGAPEHGIRRT